MSQNLKDKMILLVVGTLCVGLLGILVLVYFDKVPADQIVPFFLAAASSIVTAIATWIARGTLENERIMTVKAQLGMALSDLERAGLTK